MGLKFTALGMGWSAKNNKLLPRFGSLWNIEHYKHKKQEAFNSQEYIIFKFIYLVAALLQNSLIC